jgi:hypothetical protein
MDAVFGKVALPFQLDFVPPFPFFFPMLLMKSFGSSGLVYLDLAQLLAFLARRFGQIVRH